jgi:hypothetical protein
VHGEASVLLSFDLAFYCSAALYGLYKQAQRACCCLWLSVTVFACTERLGNGREKG